MKKCVVISDSFKGTLSSIDICEIAEKTILQFFPECQVIGIPISDGGEGMVACFQKAIGVEPISVCIHGPYGEKMMAVYGRRERLAVVEMAAAVGLPLVKGRENPEATSTYGVGELIVNAIQNGCNEIILGLGGSATNDCGCGCAAAMGVKFYDVQGNSFIPVGKTLDKICSIDTSVAKKLLCGVRVVVMCDVDISLYGPNGAAYVFAAQKGANPEMVARLDRQLQAFDTMVQKEFGISVAEMPGAGAGGGFGAGCVVFLNAEMKMGTETILDIVNFDHCIEGADLVITGEGRIDRYSLHGKVLSGVAKHTKTKGIPLLAIVGSIAESATEAYDFGVTAMFSTNREGIVPLDNPKQNAENYQRTLSDICRMLVALT